MNPKKNKQIDIAKMFDEEQTEFLESLNEQIKAGMEANNLRVDKFDMIQTQYGESLRIELTDLDTEIEYSFLVSGKVFIKLFEANVNLKDKIKIYLNEKEHWRFEFVP